jgi:hypothetical protein
MHWYIGASCMFAPPWGFVQTGRASIIALQLLSIIIAIAHVAAKNTCRFVIAKYPQTSRPQGERPFTPLYRWPASPVSGEA